MVPPARNFARLVPITATVRYSIPNRVNVTVFVAQVCASLACLAIASRLQGTWMLVPAVVFAFVMQTGFSLLHEAEHKKLHASRRLNDLMGFIVAAIFPGSYSFMTLAHLSHHKKNRADAELVDYVRPHENPAVKAVQYYLLICGFIWLGTTLASIAIALVPMRWLERRVKQSGAAAEYLQFVLDAKPSRVRAEMIIVALTWATLAWSLSLTWTAWAVCYGAFAFSWASQQYVYHIRSPRHLIEGAYDLKLTRPLQWLYLNFNFHLQHHRHVNVPWIYMAQMTGEEPTRHYWPTYVALFLPPQPVEEAWPRAHQTHGPVPLKA